MPRRVGEKIAAAAGLQGECTFTLVNSDVVNAFAVPGCYIYVTRGLMGIVNSEAELASVLAHEVGHIVAAHNRRSRGGRCGGASAYGRSARSPVRAISPGSRAGRPNLHPALLAVAGI